jgi:hypothetical protein
VGAGNTNSFPEGAMNTSCSVKPGLILVFFLPQEFNRPRQKTMAKMNFKSGFIQLGYFLI